MKNESFKCNIAYCNGISTLLLERLSTKSCGVGKMKNRKSNSEMMAGTAVAYISIQIKKKTTRRLLEIALASSIIRGGVVC
jgi:hypothetical protein